VLFRSRNADQPKDSTWYVYTNTPDDTEEFSVPPYQEHDGLNPADVNNSGVMAHLKYDTVHYDAATQMTATPRESSCASIASDDKSKPWRLPTIKELIDIFFVVENDLDKYGFMAKDAYWSASSLHHDSYGTREDIAFTVTFNVGNGILSNNGKSEDCSFCSARCVRDK
jgi:hypothetical protein